MAKLAKGTSISVGDAASPEVFTPITGVTEVNVPNPEMGTEETTDHDTTDRSREHQGTLVEPGNISFMFKVDESDALQAALKTDLPLGTIKNYQTSIPTSPAEVDVFAALVVGNEAATPVDGIYTRRVTLKLTGAIT